MSPAEQCSEEIIKYYLSRLETKIYTTLKYLFMLKFQCKFGRPLFHYEPLIKENLEKSREQIRELFQVSRRLNHIAQQVILCL